MSFLDKFLSALKLNDEYDDDDDFMDDDMDDDYEIPAPKKNSFLKKSSKPAYDDFDDFDDFDDDGFDDEPIKRKPVKSQSKPVKTASAPKQKNTQPVSPNLKSTASKVSPIRTRKTLNDMSLCVVKPKNMEESREITETLLANCPVVLNLEGIDVDLAQRLIDFTSGSTYAISGGLQRISNNIFLVTPPSVDVSGDIQDILNSAFDISSMNNYY